MLSAPALSSPAFYSNRSRHCCLNITSKNWEPNIIATTEVRNSSTQATPNLARPAFLQRNISKGQRQKVLVEPIKILLLGTPCSVPLQCLSTLWTVKSLHPCVTTSTDVLHAWKVACTQPYMEKSVEEGRHETLAFLGRHGSTSELTMKSTHTHTNHQSINAKKSHFFPQGFMKEVSAVMMSPPLFVIWLTPSF